MAFRDDDFVGEAWPGPTIRVPRGVIFHADSQGQGPPPHTIHWHGIEPTPMNDGVGHCSMEIGQYTYQFQPNFIGTYFYHCHRNTVQHFEFGLYGMLLVEPPDAYDAAIPIIAGGPPKNPAGYPRRTAANLQALPLSVQNQFPPGHFVAGDPTFGVGNAADTGVGDPHAFTIAYDVEALWVLDDRDSNWSDLADNAKAFYPGGAFTQDGILSGVGAPNVPVLTQQPGVDDQFAKGFFHDFNADYWFVTGVPVPAARGGRAEIDPTLVPPEVLAADGTILPQLNSGVSGMQVIVDATTDQTVLLRVLNGAYNSVEVTFPVDVVIIAFDGRALGVPPFARYNHAFVLHAGQPMHLSTARRFDALLRSSVEIDDVATVRFFDTRGQKVRPDTETLLMTAEIPIRIRAADDDV
jgi:FtsP/CotA-like multicopper oxidase with cupredoxin domain